MAVFMQELDLAALKVQRAIRRARCLHKKRQDFAARSEERTTPRAQHKRDSAKAKATPHRVVRAATRMCLAKGLVEASTDVPTVVFMDGSGWRKPSATPMMSFHVPRAEPTDAELEPREKDVAERLSNSEAVSFSDEADAETTAPEDSSDVEAMGAVSRSRFSSEDSSKSTSSSELLEPLDMERTEPEEEAAVPRAAADADVRQIRAQAEERARELLTQLELQSAEAVKAEAAAAIAVVPIISVVGEEKLVEADEEWEMLADHSRNEPSDVSGWSVVA